MKEWKEREGKEPSVEGSGVVRKIGVKVQKKGGKKHTFGSLENKPEQSEEELPAVAYTGKTAEFKPHQDNDQDEEVGEC